MNTVKSMLFKQEDEINNVNLQPRSNQIYPPKIIINLIQKSVEKK